MCSHVSLNFNSCVGWGGRVSFLVPVGGFRRSQALKSSLLHSLSKESERMVKTMNAKIIIEMKHDEVKEVRTTIY